jgi:hypothetical protein
VDHTPPDLDKTPIAGRQPQPNAPRGAIFGDALQAGLDGMPPIVPALQRQRAEQELPVMVDNSPPGLPPLNAPGGQDVSPVVGTPPSKAGGTDYAAMLAEIVGPKPKMSTGQKIAAVVGPMLMAATGNQAGATQMMQMIQGRRDDWQNRQRSALETMVKWRRDDDLAEQKRNEPQYWSGSEDRVRFDPATNTATRVYDAPQDFEDYAAASGHEPGTPEYFRAVEDHVLRGNGPTAFQFDRDLEVMKNAHRISVEGQRQRDRERLRGLPSYRDLNPPAPRTAAPRAPARQSLPVVSSPAEAMKLPSGTRFKTPDGKVKVRP